MNPFSEVKNRTDYKNYIDRLIRTVPEASVLYRFVPNLSSDVYRALINSLMNGVISVQELHNLEASDANVRQYLNDVLVMLRMDFARPEFKERHQYILEELGCREIVLTKNVKQVTDLNSHVMSYQLVREKLNDIIFTDELSVRDRFNNIVLHIVYSKLGLSALVPLANYFESNRVVGSISSEWVRNKIKICYENIMGDLLSYLNSDKLYRLFLHEKHKTLPAVIQYPRLSELYDYKWPDERSINFVYMVVGKMIFYNDSTIEYNNPTYNWLLSVVEESNVPVVGIKTKLNQALIAMHILSQFNLGDSFDDGKRIILQKIEAVGKIIDSIITNIHRMKG